MRRFALALSLSSFGLMAQTGTAPPPLKDYQNKALEHLWTKPAKPEFRPNFLQLHQVLSPLSRASVKLESACAIPLQQVPADKKLDQSMRKGTSVFNETMPRLSGVPACSSAN